MRVGVLGWVEVAVTQNASKLNICDRLLHKKNCVSGEYKLCPAVAGESWSVYVCGLGRPEVKA